MINEKQARGFCGEDITQIENYDKAMADKEQTWDCHHRGEILPCGVYSVSDLKRFDLYFNRPASELIFLTHAEHISLHKKGNKYFQGKKHSEDTKKKLSEALKGNKHALGCHRSEEERRKLSEAKKGDKSYWFGKKLPEEVRRKKSEAMKRYWANRRKTA